MYERKSPIPKWENRIEYAEIGKVKHRMEKVVVPKRVKEGVPECALCHKKIIYPLAPRGEYCNLCFEMYPLIIKNR